MIVRFAGCNSIELTPAEIETLNRLIDAVTQNSDITPPTIEGDKLVVCSIYDMAWVMAARYVLVAESPDADVDNIEIDDMILALATRGLLRIAGIHAKVRLVQEGRTTRDDLMRARDIASYLSLLVSYD